MEPDELEQPVESNARIGDAATAAYEARRQQARDAAFDRLLAKTNPEPIISPDQDLWSHRPEREQVIAEANTQSDKTGVAKLMEEVGQSFRALGPGYKGLAYDLNAFMLENPAGVPQGVVSGAIDAGQPFAESFAPLVPDVKLPTIMQQGADAWRMILTDNATRDDIIKSNMDTAKRYADEVAATMPQAGNDVSAGVSQGVYSIGMMVPSVLASIATKNPAVGLSMMGTQTGANAYGEARREGATPEKAYRYALEMAAIEVATERLPMKTLIGDITEKTPFFQAVRKQLIQDGIGEQFATFFQDMATWIELNPEKSVSEFLEERPSAAIQTAVASAMASIGLGGASQIGRLRNRDDEDEGGEDGAPAPEAPTEGETATQPPSGPQETASEPEPLQSGLEPMQEQADAIVEREQARTQSERTVAELTDLLGEGAIEVEPPTQVTDAPAPVESEPPAAVMPQEEQEIIAQLEGAVDYEAVGAAIAAEADRIAAAEGAPFERVEMDVDDISGSEVRAVEAIESHVAATNDDNPPFQDAIFPPDNDSRNGTVADAAGYLEDINPKQLARIADGQEIGVKIVDQAINMLARREHGFAGTAFEPLLQKLQEAKGDPQALQRVLPEVIEYRRHFFRQRPDLLTQPWDFDPRRPAGQRPRPQRSETQRQARSAPDVEQADTVFELATALQERSDYRDLTVEIAAEMDLQPADVRAFIDELADGNTPDGMDAMVDAIREAIGQAAPDTQARTEDDADEVQQDFLDPVREQPEPVDGDLVTSLDDMVEGQRNAPRPGVEQQPPPLGTRALQAVERRDRNALINALMFENRMGLADAERAADVALTQGVPAPAVAQAAAPTVEGESWPSLWRRVRRFADRPDAVMRYEDSANDAAVYLANKSKPVADEIMRDAEQLGTPAEKQAVQDVRARVDAMRSVKASRAEDSRLEAEQDPFEFEEAFNEFQQEWLSKRGVIRRYAESSNAGAALLEPLAAIDGLVERMNSVPEHYQDAFNSLTKNIELFHQLQTEVQAEYEATGTPSPEQQAEYEAWTNEQLIAVVDQLDIEIEALRDMKPSEAGSQADNQAAAQEASEAFEEAISALEGDRAGALLAEYDGYVLTDDTLVEQGMEVAAKIRRNLDELWDEVTARARSRKAEVEYLTADGVVQAVEAAADIADAFEAKLRRYSRPRNTFFARGAQTGNRARRVDLERAAVRAFGRDAERLISTGRVNFVDSMRNVAANVPSNTIALSTTDGVFVSTRISPSQVPGLMLHEIGIHDGLEGLLGAQGKQDVLAEMDRLVASNNVQAVVARERAERYALDPSHVREETLAYLVQYAPDAPFVTRMIAKMKTFIAQRFPSLIPRLRFNTADFRQLAIVSVRAAGRTGRQVAVSPRAEAQPGQAQFSIREAGQPTIPSQAEVARDDANATMIKDHANAMGMAMREAAACAGGLAAVAGAGGVGAMVAGNLIGLSVGGAGGIMLAYANDEEGRERRLQEYYDQFNATDPEQRERLRLRAELDAAAEYQAAAAALFERQSAAVRERFRDIDNMPTGSWFAMNSWAEQQTGVDAGFLDDLIGQESAGDWRAMASTSSAGGGAQFIDSTWLREMRKHGPKYGLDSDASTARILNLRYDPRWGTMIAAEHTRSNVETMQNRLGGQITQKQAYIAHFLGVDDAIKAYRADQDANAAEMFPDAADANRNVFYINGNLSQPRTVGQMLRRQERKFSDAPALVNRQSIEPTGVDDGRVDRGPMV